MLQSIHVKNFALIDEVEIDLSNGLNILTGETGAGKSIIIDAVNFALGKKLPKDIVREDADYALSELVFSVTDEKVIEKLKDLDIVPDDGMLVLSKKIVNGRASAKINGETATSSTLKNVASLLIDIHGQHEHQSLLAENKHIDILDSFLVNELKDIKNKYATVYSDYLSKKKELFELTDGGANKERELALLKYEVNEIDAASLVIGEDETLEADYRKMVNAKKLAESISIAHAMTGYDGDGAGSLIGRALSNIKGVSSIDEDAKDLELTLTDIDSLLNDFNRMIAGYEETLEFSNEDFTTTENRMNLVNTMKQKYGNSIEAVLRYRDDKEAEIKKFEDFDSYVAELESAVNKLKAEVISLCETISDIRKKKALALSNDISEALKDLNFLDSNFEIEVESDESNLSAKGFDAVKMLISTNPGERLKPLSLVASGGEMSRIMLAIKSIMADNDEISTLIFDEIDTGISGRTAQKVSEKMAYIAREHQVICVTHLPQIAAMADNHYEITKSVSEGKTTTSVALLTEDAVVKELARMLGGVSITDAVIENAREMKTQANDVKDRM